MSNRANTSNPAGERIVVVGNGMVGHRFCEQVHELGVTERNELVVFGAEPRAAYDRVHLSEFFSGRGAEELSLTSQSWYAERGIDLRLGRAIESIDRGARTVVAEGGERVEYDRLVLATGAAPLVPPIPGVDLPGVFLYRTIDDLGAIRAWARSSRRAAVIGGGLLGLEAAKALLDLGLDAHVIEFADRLMPRQLDSTGARLLRNSIENLGVTVHLGAATEAIVGENGVTGLRFAGAPDLELDLVIVSAGIRPRDQLAQQAGLALSERGGIVVDDDLETSDPRISAIGECAVHRGVHYGLVAPGYEMADVLARRIAGENATFNGADLSAQLKLLGVDVASFGDYFADLERPDGFRTLVFEDLTAGVYQKLLFDAEAQHLVGGILVGDTSDYVRLLGQAKSTEPLSTSARELLFGRGADEPPLSDDALLCSCNGVAVGALREAIGGAGLTTIAELKAHTKAGTGCGGCLGSLGKVLEVELEKLGTEVNRHLCEHFAYTREELFWIVKLGRIESFDALLDSHGTGDGCEVCRPAVASILASTWNDLVLRHAHIQDTNDRFLANIQRGGTYSVVPRVAGGEITPDKLIALGEVAKRYDLYCKITGGQRIDLLGAQIEQLPDIWEELVAAGFESGHAYAKAMRTVKSCIGSTWCRYGVQDSTAFAIRVEERYRGLRAPHKLKSAVSGCIRECAEAQSKDFGIIATEQGWNVYVGGNGGSNPRHAELLASDCPDDEVIAILDRFLMFYIQTAKPLQRTARWLEELPGGIDYLKGVVLEDSLGITAQLERDMQQLVDTYECEWRRVVEDPELRREFRRRVNPEVPDDAPHFVRERDQRRPIDWPDVTPPTVPALQPESTWSWIDVAATSDFPRDGGRVVLHGAAEIAVFRFDRRGEWYATQNMCPHRKDPILARGMLGTDQGEPKIACPLHKKTFSLRSGKGLSDPEYRVQTFPVRVRGDRVLVKLPPVEQLPTASCAGSS